MGSPNEPSHLAVHPPAPTQEWDYFEVVTGAPNVPVPIEEAGAGGRMASRALINADATNTADILIGPDSQANMDKIFAGTGYQIPDLGSGRKFVLGNWWIKSANASQKIKVSYV